MQFKQPQIAVVIILYNPTEQHLKHLSKIRTKAELIIVDNSSKEQEICLINEYCYIPLKQNVGIAKAQNIGISVAEEHGCSHVVFFDQDSEFDDTYIDSLLEEYEDIKISDPKIATLGPIIVNKETNIEYKTDKTSNRVSSIISSGSIVEISVFHKVGVYDSDLFVDLVDTEWCFRAISMGFSIYKSSKVLLYHMVGSKSKSVLGLPIIISAPTRYYYQYRNAIKLLRRNYVPYKWKIKMIVRKSFEFIYIPLISKDGGLVIRNMCKGIKDALSL